MDILYDYSKQKVKTMKIESTKGKYCYKWGPTEAKSPDMFKDFTVCHSNCACYSIEFDTCIDYALKYVTIKKEIT